jgi:septal ring factor EnvC (AmiA/AmiB activator)
MAKEQREMAPDLLSRLTELLGLSARRVRRKLRWGRLLILVPTETDQDADRPKSENAQLVQALRERIGALEQRLDRVEAERRQLVQEADAERTMLLQAIVEANKSKWPGLWAWLKHVWLGETTKSDRPEYRRQSPV